SLAISMNGSLRSESGCLLADAPVLTGAGVPCRRGLVARLTGVAGAQPLPGDLTSKALLAALACFAELPASLGPSFRRECVTDNGVIDLSGRYSRGGDQPIRAGALHVTRGTPAPATNLRDLQSDAGLTLQFAYNFLDGVVRTATRARIRWGAEARDRHIWS